MKNFYLLFFTVFSMLSTTFAQISSTAVGGEWNDPNTWIGNVVPGITDDVIIAGGATVIIDANSSANTLSIAQGLLQFSSATPTTLTVADSIIISASGSFQTSPVGNETGHILNVGGSLINEGLLDFSTNGNTAGARITFTGADNAIFGGSGNTDIFAITLDKGNSRAPVLELNPTGIFTFQGQTSTAGTVPGFLTILNGTFQIAGTFTMDNGLFEGTGSYLIPPTGGLWLNNPNFTVSARTGSALVEGLLRMDAGTLNIGTANNNRLGYILGTVIEINGGTINVASRFSATSTFGLTYIQTGGTLNLNTVESNSTTYASFDIRPIDLSSFTMTGGIISIQNAGIGGDGPRDYSNDAVTTVITGGTLQIGNANSNGAQTYYINGDVPSLVIDNTAGGHTVQLLGNVNVFGNTDINTGTTLDLGDGVNGYIYNQFGTDFTNDGTLSGSFAGSVLNFAGTSAQTFSGTGVITSPLSTLQINNAAGLTFTGALGSEIVVNQLNMIAGDINTGVNTLTLGTSTANLGTFNYTSGTIAGRFKRWVDASATTVFFPVGIPGSTRTALVDFTTSPTTGGTITAEFIPAYGGTNGLPLTEPGYAEINNVAADGYWSLVPGDGLTGGTYSATFTATNFISVTDFTQLVLVKRDDNASPWTLEGVHVPTTGSNTTPILSRTGLSTWGEFGVGGSELSLPIYLVYFRGTKKPSGNVIDWKITCYNSPTAVMVLERSTDGIRFNSITSITASALRCLQPFDYNDASPVSGINYYRLRLTDSDNKTTYSNIIALLNKDKGFDMISLMPNPVVNTAFLSVASAKASQLQIVISDVSGRSIERRSIQVAAGSNTIPLDLSKLPAGTYQLTGVTTDGGNKTLRFVKN